MNSGRKRHGGKPWHYPTRAPKQDVPRVEVYRLNEAGRYGDPHLLEGGDTLTTDLLPGFSLQLDLLYAGLSTGEGNS